MQKSQFKCASAYNLKELYEIDDYLWVERTIELLKEKKFDDLDLENLIEELEDLGRERKNKVESLLRQIIIDLLLLEYWSQEYQYNAAHWQAEITEFRFQINGILTKNLQSYLASKIELIYQNSVKYTQRKTNLNIFPEKCPYTLKQLLDEDWFPTR
ncbi:MAG: DUF29 family protein [Cyanobacteria bacterium]|nr:DUF29 family protein [Cyanobacteria bacterium GSL.Bin21]